MNEIFFSIITPTYNRDYQIINTINSVVSQTFFSYEFIIVDDASTDDTSILLHSLSKRNNFITITNKLNLGVNKSKNIGSAVAKGKYLIFLDSDDQFKDSESLAIIHNTIISNNNPLLLMFACVDKFDREILYYSDLKGFFHYKYLYDENFLLESLPVVNRLIFLEYKFFENIMGGEGITWKLISKSSMSIFLSNIVVRIYDNVSTDRLSFKNINNIIRIKNVLKLDIKIFLWDYLQYNWFILFKNILKIFFYILKIKINKINGK